MNLLWGAGDRNGRISSGQLVERKDPRGRGPRKRHRSYHEDSKAYEALADLKELDAHEQIKLRAAAVVVRGEDGRIVVNEQVGGDDFPTTAAGGLIGLIVGNIGGPLGILIGGATGLLTGALFESDDEEMTESVLAQISRSVSAEHATLLAQLSESSPLDVDTLMAALGGTVLREGAGTVMAEIAAAEAAQHAAKKVARKELREKRETQSEQEVHAKVEALKAKLHPHNATGKQTAGTAAGA